MKRMNERSLITRIAIGAVVVVTAGALAAPARADLAVKFFGTAVGGDLTDESAQAMADTGVDVSGFGCFELPILDLETGHRVGVGVDCLNVFDAAGDGSGDGLQIEAKTFFFLPQGTIVNHGCTSVRPFFAGVGNVGVTHMTGSIGPEEFGGTPDDVMPDECVDAGGIIYTSEGFKNFDGEARLSGAVNLSNAGDGEITFSCLFVIQLDPLSKPSGRALSPNRGNRGVANR
jgi:hypothetical protein